MYILRHIHPNDKLHDQLDGHLFSSIFPQEDIEICSAQFPSSTTRRKRDFTPQLLFYLLLMHALWFRRSWGHVWEKMAHAFSDLHPSCLIHTCSDEAISEQRALFDVRILHLMMQRCCRPLCTLQRHPNAFYHARHLMAIDGTKFNTADTKANATAFGRSSNQYGEGPFPQIQAVVLMECGSRAVFDLVLGTYAQAEIHALPTLLQRIPAGSLVLTDSAFFSTWFFEQLQDTVGADGLSALSSTTALKVEKRLADGSYLTTMPPNHRKGAYQGTRPITIRVIEYVITDERVGEPGKCYRLATTLLDAEAFPAGELIELYHERWEVETMLDEAKTHLREQVKVIRSRTPEGVKQEVYGLFLMHYAISFLKLQAAEERGEDPDRISFTGAVIKIQDALGDSLRYDPSCHERVISRLIQRIAVAQVLPPRRLRMNPREIKLFYQRHKLKKRNVPAPEPFDPDDVFLDFVKVWVRPEEVRPMTRTRQRKKASTNMVKKEA
jgi:Transposase DDE domain